MLTLLFSFPCTGSIIWKKHKYFSILFNGHSLLFIFSPGIKTKQNIIWMASDKSCAGKIWWKFVWPSPIMLTNSKSGLLFFLTPSIKIKPHSQNLHLHITEITQIKHVKHKLSSKFYPQPMFSLNKWHHRLPSCSSLKLVSHAWFLLLPQLQISQICLRKSIFIATTVVQVTIILNLLVFFYHSFAVPPFSIQSQWCRENNLLTKYDSISLLKTRHVFPLSQE